MIGFGIYKEQLLVLEGFPMRLDIQLIEEAIQSQEILVIKLV